MRKYFAIVLMGFLLLFTACTAPLEPLSEEEIAILREEYPMLSVYDTVGPLVEIIPASMDHVVSLSEHWVWVKVGEQLPDEVVYTGGGGSARKWVYQIYEMEVVESVYGDLKSKDTFLLALTETRAQGFPPLEPGCQYLIGMVPNELKEYENVYTTILECMFYVTEDDYVLSVAGLEKETAQQLSYTGQYVTEVIKAIRDIRAQQS